jgi:hypothetical protein
MQDRCLLVAEINRLMDEQTLALQVPLRGEEADRYVDRRQRIEMLLEILNAEEPAEA